MSFPVSDGVEAASPARVPGPAAGVGDVELPVLLSLAEVADRRHPGRVSASCRRRAAPAGYEPRRDRPASPNNQPSIPASPAAGICMRSSGPIGRRTPQHFHTGRRHLHRQ